MQGPVQQAIYSLEYRSVRAIAPELAALLARYMTRRPITGDLLVPVPLHSKRLRSRGYNQSALLAGELGKLTGLAVDESLVFRTRNAPPQVNAASQEQRRTNVEDSFRCTADVSGMEVILLDDVATTGSTLSACAAALKDAGAASVWGLTVAREV
jgi:ComF family protein